MPIQNLKSVFFGNKEKVAILAIFLFSTVLLFLYLNSKISPKGQVIEDKQEEVFAITPKAVSNVTLSLVSDKTSLNAGETANISLKAVSVPASYKFLGFIASIKVPKDFDRPVIGANNVAFPGFTYDFQYSEVVDKTDYWEVQVLAANSKSNPLSLTNNTVLFTFPIKVATATTATKTSNISFIQISASDIPAIISADETLATLATNDLSISLNPLVAPTLTLDPVTKVYGNAPFDMVYTTNNSSGAKTFTSSNTAVATVTNAGRVTITGVGSTTITFNVGASGGFSAGSKTAVVTITQKALTITGLSVTKVYDKTSTATATGTPTLVGVVAGDSVAVSATGVSYAFANANVGTDKPLTRTGNYLLTGTSASRYTLTQPTLTGTITQKPITGSFTASNKVYDGNTTATVLTRSLSGVISGDSATLSGGTATFANANVGTGKTVTLTGATLTGASAGNYLLSSVATATANITRANQAALTVIATPATGTAGTAVALSTSGGSGSGTVTYATSTAACSISGASLTTTTPGTCSVTATKAASEMYNAITSPAETVTFNGASQATLTITTTSGTAGTNLTLATSGGSGTGAVTYVLSTSNNTAGCILSGATLSSTTGGSCKVTATKAASGIYNAVSSALTTITLSTVKGDLDGNGSVNVVDVQNLVVLIFAGGATTEQIARGDMNSDGKLDVRDAFLIVELIFN